MIRWQWLSSFALAGALGVALSGAAACDGGAPGASCSDIPAGGCPTDADADVCADATCAAVYDCENDSWVFVQTCPAHPDPGGAPADAGHEAAPVADANIDAPPGAYGGPGCIDLEAPDCDVGTALLCSGASDCCGCQDLFVCQNGGWMPWGDCVDGGVVQSQ